MLGKDPVHISEVVKVVMENICKKAIRNGLEKGIKEGRHDGKEAVTTEHRS